MRQTYPSDCVATLLDAIGYELIAGRLSAEMASLLWDHLCSCGSCRRRMLSYLEMSSPTRVATGRGKATIHPFRRSSGQAAGSGGLDPGIRAEPRGPTSEKQG